MEKDEVVTGRTYLTKIGGKLVPVRIDEARPLAGWYGTDRTTNERVQITNAKELRREILNDEIAWEVEIAEAPTRKAESVMAETPSESDKPATEAADPAEPEVDSEGQQATPAQLPTVPATPSYDERLMSRHSRQRVAPGRGRVLSVGAFLHANCCTVLHRNTSPHTDRPVASNGTSFRDVAARTVRRLDHREDARLDDRRQACPNGDDSGKFW